MSQQNETTPSLKMEDYPHHLVWNPSMIEEFLKFFYQPSDRVYMHLQTRRKYGYTTDRPNCVMSKKLVRAKEVTQTLISVGCTFYDYSGKDQWNDKAIDVLNDRMIEQIPPCTMVWYASVEPRDEHAAFQATTLNLVEQSFQLNKTKLVKAPTKEWYRQVDQHATQRRWLDVDIDDKSLLEPFLQAIAPVQPALTIESRGGYHLLLDTRDAQVKQLQTKLYTQIIKDDQFCVGEGKKRKQLVELKKNPRVPIPGTYQGGFPVKLID
jgi:hypothetical protein